MPNYVRNVVKCDKMDVIKKYYVDEDGDFTFTKVIPRPSWIDLKPIPVNDVSEVEDWYSWDIRNWDTKWDACEPAFITKDGTEYLQFDTAWSMPDNVFRELSAQLDCRVEVAYADEDIGSNCGIRVYDGHVLTMFINKARDYDFSARMNGYESYEASIREWEDDEETIKGLLKDAEETKKQLEEERAKAEKDGPHYCRYCGAVL